MDLPVIIIFGESTVIFRGIRSDFDILFQFHFSMKILLANRIAPDGMTQDGMPWHSGSGHLFAMSYKKNVRLMYELNTLTYEFGCIS